MSVRVRTPIYGSNNVSLENWLNFELTLDMLADVSKNIAENPSAYTRLLNKTVTASINNETLEFEVIDLARYDKSDGSGKAGVVLMASKFCLSTLHMMSSTIGSSWLKSEMRSWLNSIPRPSQAVQVKVPYVASRSNPSTSYTDDYLFIPSVGEISGLVGPSGYSDIRNYEGDIFSGVTDEDDWRIRYYYDEDEDYVGKQWYWLRTPTTALSGGYYGVSTSGYSNNTQAAQNDSGVVPVFCI